MTAISSVELADDAMREDETFDKSQKDQSVPAQTTNQIQKYESKPTFINFLKKKKKSRVGKTPAQKINWS